MSTCVPTKSLLMIRNTIDLHRKLAKVANKLKVWRRSSYPDPPDTYMTEGRSGQCGDQPRLGHRSSLPTWSAPEGGEGRVSPAANTANTISLQSKSNQPTELDLMMNFKKEQSQNASSGCMKQECMQNVLFFRSKQKKGFTLSLEPRHLFHFQQQKQI